MVEYGEHLRRMYLQDRQMLIRVKPDSPNKILGIMGQEACGPLPGPLLNRSERLLDLRSSQLVQCPRLDLPNPLPRHR